MRGKNQQIYDRKMHVGLVRKGAKITLRMGACPIENEGTDVRWEEGKDETCREGKCVRQREGKRHADK